MDLHKIIEELQTEKRRLDEAIDALEKLSSSGARRRVVPPHKAQPAAEDEEFPVESRAAAVQS